MTDAAPAIGTLDVAARIDRIRARFEPAPTTTVAPSGTATAPAAGPDEFAALLRAAGVDTTGRLLPQGRQLAPALPAGSLVGSPMGSAAGDAVVRQGMTYLGVPYLWGGTDPNVGLDCSGFVQRVHRDLGIELPRVSRDQAKGGQPVDSLAEARPGDVLAFGEPVNHVAIYTGNGMMVHAPRRGDVVTHEPIDRPITAIRRYTPSAPVAPTFGGAVWAPTGGGEAAFADLFAAAGARHGIDPRILSAVARVESGYDPTAVSSAGARGLMQFMPATAAGMGIDPMDPAQAIDGAARYLTTQMRDFGSLELALAAYNAGPGAVRRHGGVPPYAETQNYVTKVMDILNGAR